MKTGMPQVAAAMDQTSTNINFIAAAAEEMTATVTEIVQKTRRKAIVNTAVSQAHTASQRVTARGRAAQEILRVNCRM